MRSAGDVLIGRIEPDRSVTLIPGALDVADTIFVQWEAVAEGAATGRFRIAPAGGGATVLTVPAEIESEATASGRVRATAVVRQGLLPVGDLEIVGELTRDTTVIVDRRRAFAVRGSAAPAGGATTSAAALGALVGDISGLVPRFTRDDVLASPLLARALDVLSSRARSDAARQAIARARAGQHTAPEASLATRGDAATAAFLSGLADLAALPGPAADPSARALARADLERAAQRFRDALRADADFLPAAVFLGACYALGGRDQDAAGAWQTALIGIDDDPRLFALIVDARLRAGDAAGAEDVAAEAEKRWPADAGAAAAAARPRAGARPGRGGPDGARRAGAAIGGPAVRRAAHPARCARRGSDCRRSGAGSRAVRALCDALPRARRAGSGARQRLGGGLEIV